MLSQPFGTRAGAFFSFTPEYVDSSRPPGFSAIPTPTFSAWLRRVPVLLLFTPNGLWGTIALIFYAAFPYDLSQASAASASPLSLAFISQRWPLWAALVFSYTGFWHVALYGFRWASRPFIPGRPYSIEKTLHNVWWSAVGVSVWVCVENVFAFLWATGRLRYVSDVSASGSLSGAITFVAALLLVPAWRDVHFFFVHRLLHWPPLYAAVHSLHHRNTDVEPFSGLSMHPVEHLYYFTSVLPSLLFVTTPFAFLWNGVHLLLAPGASHSGWEDHWQSDQFHYLHHRYFERNYAGRGAAWLDAACGTFCARFAEAESGAPVRPRVDVKATLRCGGASSDSIRALWYFAGVAACVGPWVWAAVASGGAERSPVVSVGLSLVAGGGPVILAAAAARYRQGAAALAVEVPPQKELPATGAPTPLLSPTVQLAIGAVVGVLPVCWACALALLPPSAPGSSL